MLLAWTCVTSTSALAMSECFDPFNADRPPMFKCSCGRDHAPADHHAEVVADAVAAQLRARSEKAEFLANFCPASSRDETFHGGDSVGADNALRFTHPWMSKADVNLGS